MDEWIRTVIAVATEKWDTRTGLAIVIGAVVVSLLALFAGVDLAAVSGIEWGVVAISASTVWFLWHRTRVPKAPKGKIGFGIALDLEPSDGARQLRVDFVDSMRELLEQSNLKHQFAFVHFPPRIAKQISSEQVAREFAPRANIHFLLYGRARQRTLAQGPAHVIDLHGLVRHAPVPQEVSAKLGDDFRAALPHRLIVNPQGDMFACELAARHVDAAARYIIGTAAALSNEFDYAEQLLLDAEKRLAEFVAQAEGAPLSVLLDRVRNRIRDLYSAQLTRLMRRYMLRRDAAVLTTAEGVIAKLRLYEPESYQARLAAATCAFVLRRDLTQAKAEIDACSTIGDGIWLYNSAFLYAYTGNLQDSYRAYRQAFSSPLQDPTVPMQCEEFIQIVIDEEPERFWLFYCLGLINHRAKRDLESARRDFRTFVNHPDSERFPIQAGAARKWLLELDAVLGRDSTP